MLLTSWCEGESYLVWCVGAVPSVLGHPDLRSVDVHWPSLIWSGVWSCCSRAGARVRAISSGVWELSRLCLRILDQGPAVAAGQSWSGLASGHAHGAGARVRAVSSGHAHGAGARVRAVSSGHAHGAGARVRAISSGVWKLSRLCLRILDQGPAVAAEQPRPGLASGHAHGAGARVRAISSGVWKLSRLCLRILDQNSGCR